MNITPALEEYATTPLALNVSTALKHTFAAEAAAVELAVIIAVVVAAVPLPVPLIAIFMPFASPVTSRKHSNSYLVEAVKVPVVRMASPVPVVVVTVVPPDPV